jgi:hypothetical protein
MLKGALLLVSPGSGSWEPDASNCTSREAVPFWGMAVAATIGGWFPEKYWIRLSVPSSNSA